MKLLSFPTKSFQLIHFPAVTERKFFGFVTREAREPFDVPGRIELSSFEAELDYPGEYEPFRKFDFEYDRYKFYGVFISQYPDPSRPLRVVLRCDQFVQTDH